MKVVIASLSVVSKNMVAVDGFVEDISSEPCFLHKINVNSFLFHDRDEVFISRVIKWGIDDYIASVVLWTAAKAMCILGEEFLITNPWSVDGFVEMGLQF